MSDRRETVNPGNCPAQQSNSMEVALKTPINGLIRPFNLDPPECSAMYLSPLPEQLVMNLTILIPADDCDGSERLPYKNDHFELVRVAHDCTLNAGRFNIHSAIVDTLDYREETTAEWWSLSDPQRQWLCRGAYVQVHFLNPALVGGVLDPEMRAILCMTVYDRLVSERGELDPSMHKPFRATPRLASNHAEFVDRIYAEGTAIWTHGLVDFRSMVMIKARAVLAGRNPDDEYDRFVKAGGTYFLDYSALCP